MDMERCSRDAMDPNLRHKPRLISEEELPSWLLIGVEEVCLVFRCNLPISSFQSLPSLPFPPSFLTSPSFPSSSPYLIPNTVIRWSSWSMRLTRVVCLVVGLELGRLWTTLRCSPRESGSRCCVYTILYSGIPLIWTLLSQKKVS